MRKRYKWLSPILMVGIMVLIFLFSSQDATASDQTSGFLVKRVLPLILPAYDTLSPEAQQSAYDAVSFIIRKLAHMTEFALLGFSIRLFLEAWFGNKKRKLSLFAWLGGTLYACTDELHQLLVSARSGQIRDVFIDSFGVMMGVILAWVVITLVRKKKEIGLSDQQT